MSFDWAVEDRRGRYGRLRHKEEVSGGVASLGWSGGWIPRGIVSVDPCVVITKPFHAISRGRCGGVTKPYLRAIGKQGRARKFKSASRESFYYLRKARSIDDKIVG